MFSTSEIGHFTSCYLYDLIELTSETSYYTMD